MFYLGDKDVSTPIWFICWCILIISLTHVPFLYSLKMVEGIWRFQAVRTETLVWTGIPAGIYLLKVNNETPEQCVKSSQS